MRLLRDQLQMLTIQTSCSCNLILLGKILQKRMLIVVFFCQSRSESSTKFNWLSKPVQYFSCGKYLFDKYAFAFYHISGESQGDKDLLMSEQSKDNIFPQPIKISTLGE